MNEKSELVLFWRGSSDFWLWRKSLLELLNWTHKIVLFHHRIFSWWRQRIRRQTLIRKFSFSTFCLFLSSQFLIQHSQHFLPRSFLRRRSHPFNWFKIRNIRCIFIGLIISLDFFINSNTLFNRTTLFYSIFRLFHWFFIVTFFVILLLYSLGLLMLCRISTNYFLFVDLSLDIETVYSLFGGMTVFITIHGFSLDWKSTFFFVLLKIRWFIRIIFFLVGNLLFGIVDNLTQRLNCLIFRLFFLNIWQFHHNIGSSLFLLVNSRSALFFDLLLFLFILHFLPNKLSHNLANLLLLLHKQTITLSASLLFKLYLAFNI